MLAMTLLVKNERDILATNLEFHLARGIDHVIALPLHEPRFFWGH